MVFAVFVPPMAAMAPPIHRTSGKFQSCRNRFREAPKGGLRQTKASMASQSGETLEKRLENIGFMGILWDLYGILWDLMDFLGMWRWSWDYFGIYMGLIWSFSASTQVMIWGPAGKSSINGPSKPWQCDKTWRVPPVRWRPKLMLAFQLGRIDHESPWFFLGFNHDKSMEFTHEIVRLPQIKTRWLTDFQSHHPIWSKIAGGCRGSIQFQGSRGVHKFMKHKFGMAFSVADPTSWDNIGQTQ